LAMAEEKMKRKYLLRAQGMDLEKLTHRVAYLLKMKPEDVWAAGKHRRTVEARSLLCFWATAELGISQSYLANKLSRLMAKIDGVSHNAGKFLQMGMTYFRRKE